MEQAIIIKHWKYTQLMKNWVFSCSTFSSSILQYLPKHLHIVCVDMPGHEGTTRTNTEDYSVQGQVRRIHQVLWGKVFQNILYKSIC